VITARYNLGLLLVNGWGVEWNPFEAYHHFLFAAEHHMSQAQYVMGQFLTENLVVQRNWEEAYRWVKQAADSGFAPAVDALARLEKRLHEQTESSRSPGRKGGTPLADSTSHKQKAATTPQPSNLIFLDFDASDSVARADERTLLKEALSSGSAEARGALGASAGFDDTLAVDSVRIAFLRHAADAGSPEAMTVLGKCHEDGILVKKDWMKAAEYYVRALRLESPRAGPLLMSLLQQKNFAETLKSRAERSDPVAQVVWAGLFTMGLDPFLVGDTHLTPGSAFQLLQRAAAVKYVPGLLELGVWYYGGRWVKQDKDAAQEAWEKAAELGSREAEVQIAVSRIRDSDDAADLGKAIQTLSDASGDGSILATIALAYCHENGIGFQKQKGEAAKLYRRTAERGSQEAYSALKRMYDEIRPVSGEFQIRE